MIMIAMTIILPAQQHKMMNKKYKPLAQNKDTQKKKSLIIIIITIINQPFIMPNKYPTMYKTITNITTEFSPYTSWATKYHTKRL